MHVQKLQWGKTCKVIQNAGVELTWEINSQVGRAHFTHGNKKVLLYLLVFLCPHSLRTNFTNSGCASLGEHSRLEIQDEENQIVINKWEGLLWSRDFNNSRRSFDTWWRNGVLLQRFWVWKCGSYTNQRFWLSGSSAWQEGKLGLLTRSLIASEALLPGFAAGMLRTCLLEYTWARVLHHYKKFSERVTRYDGKDIWNNSEEETSLSSTNSLCHFPKKEDFGKESGTKWTQPGGHLLSFTFTSQTNQASIHYASEEGIRKINCWTYHH